jgi:hypothetical protein
MKKVILVSLCVLLVVGTSVSADYILSGHVYRYVGGVQTAVPNALVTLTIYWNDGGSSSVPVSADNFGFYYIDLPWGVVGEDCRLDASKTIGGLNYCGSKSWTANATVEIKDVYISLPIQIDDDLHCGVNSGNFVAAGTQTATLTYAYDADSGNGLTEVTSYNVTMKFEPDKMICQSIMGPLPPFDDPAQWFVDIDNVAGTFTVRGGSPGGMFIPLSGDSNLPTLMFDVTWYVQHFDTPGKIATVTVEVNDVIPISQFLTSLGPNSPVLHQTEYVIGEPNAKCNPYRRIASQQDWEEALSSGHVYAMERLDWEHYMLQWDEFVVEGEPYPNSPFLPAMPPTGNLYVYGGGGGGGALDPCDAGLVMIWGDATTPDGSYSSAWKFDYKKDPDLRNCIINVAVTAPQFSPVTGAQINKVSFGLQNPPIPGGPIRAWYWNCGAMGSGAPIIWNTPTVITIDTSKTGVGAATPTASAYMNNPGFALNNVQWLIVDEDANWVGGGTPAPAPGTGMIGMWNYWHWLMISPKTTLSKDYYKKWSQPPVVIDTNDPPIFLGWDELSDYNMPQIVADDWHCTDDRPITDIHWWGSFIGWNEPYPPPVVPKAFHIGIWTDVPDPDPCDPLNFSHPGTLIWQNYCDNFVWNFAGYDSDPRGHHDPCVPFEPTEACFQYNQLLSQDEWFHQEPDPCDPNGRVYWISISAIWPPGPTPHKWGWKTRPHYWNDDAAETNQFNPPAPPILGSKWLNGNPIQFPPYPNPDSISFDMAFELTTNEPNYADNPISGDLNADKIVNFKDVAILANNWLVSSP